MRSRRFPHRATPLGSRLDLALEETTMTSKRGLPAALAVAASALGLLAHGAPGATAEITGADKSCTAQSDGSFNCTLTLPGTVAATNVVQVTQTGGDFNQVQYVGGCATQPAVTFGAGDFSFIAPMNGCGGPVVFSENVTPSGVPGTLVENVTENTVSGAQVSNEQASVFLTTLTGSKTCQPATNTSATNTYSCTLSFQPSLNLAAPAVVSVTSSGGTLTTVQYQSGCLNTAAVTMSGSGFSFMPPSGGCGGQGPIVFSETVTGQPGTITETVSVSGTYAGSASFSAQLSSSNGGGNGNGNGDDDDHGHGNQGGDQGDDGQGDGNGQGNGHNHNVPACQNSHGRAPQKNPHCHNQGGDD
jgi:hypothetical protein